MHARTIVGNGREIKWKQPRARFNLIVAPPPSHCQERTHLGFRGGHSSAGAVGDAKAPFLSSVLLRFWKGKKGEAKPKLATPGAFFAAACGEGLGDRGPKQARQLVAKKELEGAILRGSPQPIIAANPKFLSAAGQDEPRWPRWATHWSFQPPPAATGLTPLSLSFCRKNGGR